MLLDELWAALALLPLLWYANALSRQRPAPWLRKPYTPLVLLLFCLISSYFTGLFSSPLLCLLALLILLVSRLESLTKGAALAAAAELSLALLYWKSGASGEACFSFLWPGLGLLLAYFLGRQTELPSAASSPSLRAEEEGKQIKGSDEPKGKAADFVEGAFAAAWDLAFQAHPNWNAFLLFEFKEGVLRLERGQARQGQIQNALELTEGEGLLGWAFRERKRLVNAELAESNASALPYYSQGLKVKAILATPLFDEGDFKGMLVVDRLEGGKWTPEEEAALEALARHFVQLRQLGSHFERIQVQGRRVSELYEISKALGESLEREALVGRLGTLLGRLLVFDSFYFALREGEEGGFKLAASQGYASDYTESFALGEDTVFGGWDLSEGEALAFNAGHAGAVIPKFLSAGLLEEANAFLLVPLMRQRRVAGLLKIDRRAGAPVFGEQDKEIALIFGALAAETLEHARLYSLHRRMATTDGLTGLFNHRYFQERLAVELDIARRSGKPLSLALSDIDFFKKFNDTFGHQEGDQVLKKVASLLSEQVRREKDVVCRYGGEEFVIIMPDCDLVQAREILDRLREACASGLIGGSGPQARPITLSLGLSSFPLAAEEQRELIHKADEALYKAKQTGRNRVCSFKELP